MKRENTKLKDALLKLAIGFSYSEVTEEFSPKKGSDDKVETLELSKKKITTHYVPPDMLAIKMLLQNDGQAVDDFSAMSDEELLILKNKLIKEMADEGSKKAQN